MIGTSMAVLGEFVYVYWDVATQYGDDGSVTGQELTTGLQHLVTAGYAHLVEKPEKFPDGWRLDPWTGAFVPSNGYVPKLLVPEIGELPDYLLKENLDTRSALIS